MKFSFEIDTTSEIAIEKRKYRNCLFNVFKLLKEDIQSDDLETNSIEEIFELLKGQILEIQNQLESHKKDKEAFLLESQKNAKKI